MLEYNFWDNKTLYKNNLKTTSKRDKLLSLTSKKNSKTSLSQQPKTVSWILFNKIHKIPLKPKSLTRLINRNLHLINKRQIVLRKNSLKKRSQKLYLEINPSSRSQNILQQRILSNRSTTLTKISFTMRKLIGKIMLMN